MAISTNPSAAEASGALFRALRAAGVEAELAYRADDEVRAQAGQNVIAVVNAGFSELSVKIDAVNSHIDAVNSRIDTLQRVIWPLVVLLASTVFGLLYRVFTAGGG